MPRVVLLVAGNDISHGIVHALFGLSAVGMHAL
jgi:hypothetical protein